MRKTFVSRFLRGLVGAPAAPASPGPKPAPRPPARGARRWGVTACRGLPELAGRFVEAPTKSEARALLKHACGLPRLPAGTAIEELL